MLIFTCQECEADFSTPIKLVKHTKIVHEEKAKYDCLWCSKSFSSNLVFEEHIEKCNNTLCSYCGKKKSSFGSATKYRDHYEEHLGNQHSCKLCEKTFSTETGLSDHNRKVHIGAVQCAVCDIYL